MKKYNSNTIIAYQTEKEFDINSYKGTQHVNRGDYVCTSYNGRTFVMPPEDFESVFNEVW